MNKKFSTLVAALFIAGSFSVVNALVVPVAKVQTTTAKASQLKSLDPGDLEEVGLSTDINRQSLYLVVNDKFIGYDAEKKGLTEVESLPTLKDNFVWERTEGSGLMNVSAGLYLDVDGEELVLTEEQSSIDVLTAEDEEGNPKGTLCIGGIPQTDFKATAYAAPFALPFDGISGVSLVNAGEVGQVSFGASYILMADGGAVKDNGKGVSTTKKYQAPYDQEFYWTMELKSTGSSKADMVAMFKNVATGKYLANNEDGKFVSAALVYNEAKDKYHFAENTFVLMSGNEYCNATLELSTNEGEALSFGLGAIPTGLILTGQQLTAITGSGFQASIKKNVDGGDKDKSLANNPFSGLLKPVAFTGTAAEVEAAKGGSYMLQNAAGDIIVIDLNDKYASANGTKYALKAVSAKVLANAINDSKAEIANRYAYNFSISASDAFISGVDQVVTSISASNKAGSSFKLGSVDLSAVPTLSAEPAAENFLNAITIKIGQFNTISVKKLLGSKPTFFTVTNKSIKKTSTHYGMVLGLDKDAEAAFVKASEALINYPETQWAITYKDNSLTFTNRENPKASFDPINVATIYYTDAPNVYAINGDTLEIKSVSAYNESDGYLRLNADDLRDQKYYVAAASSVFDNVAYLVENHNKDHQIGLDTKIENATTWNVATGMYEGLDNLGERIVYRPDTILVKSVLGYYSGNDYKETIDGKKEGTVMLKLVAYSFQNDANQEYLAYSTDRYATGESGKKTGFKKQSEANLFALKMVGDKLYNVIPVTGSAVDATTPDAKAWDVTKDSGYKMYSGDGATKGILNVTDMYTQTENDLFVVKMKEAPEYRKVAMGDTIKLYRNENEAQVLYEKGEFLSIDNAIQFPKINPALYVDTAFVARGNNNRWEYLLAVDAKHWKTVEECNDPSHPKHVADTTTGRFLVNLMDSANVYAATHLHDNKFINNEDGESFAKLGFVNGYHTHDTLYLQRPDGKFNALPLNRVDYACSIAKFAFRYVDQDAKSFVIETGRKEFNDAGEYQKEVSTGYLKWLNGVVVVVDEIEKADIFNMNENETRIPTANEGINASGVSVIAGNGEVIINGAAGKKVVITNVLGQTIANTVIASDNASIAAPAGVVVVAVEGEAAVKAIVK